MHTKGRALGLIALLFFYLPIALGCKPIYSRYAIDFYYGYFSRTFVQDIYLKDRIIQNTPILIGADFIYTPCNRLQPLLAKIGFQMEYGLNFAYFNDAVGKILEVNPFLAVRFTNFPWNKYLYTTAAIGDGISFANKIPIFELWENGSSKILNYTMFEYTVALPEHKNVQLFYRLHHRCNCHGSIYSPHHSVLGTTAVGFGIKFLF